MAINDGRFVSSSEVIDGLGGQDSIDALSALTDLIINQAVLNAESQVGSFLKRRYVLPLNPGATPFEMKRLVLIGVKYQSTNLPANSVPSTEERLEYKDFTSELERMSKIDGPIVSGLETHSKTSEIRAVSSAPIAVRSPVFTGHLNGLTPIYDQLSVERDNFNNPHHGHGHHHGRGHRW